MSEWRPIETAPKPVPGKNEAIDLFSIGRNIYWPHCLWSEEDEVFYSRSSFVDEYKRRVTRFVQVYDPTHWKTLPAPPEKE